VSSVSSGAGVDANPRRNREWQKDGEDEEGGAVEDAIKIKGMEVMDHATQVTKATQQTSQTSSSSFVSLNSTGESTTGLIRVASIGSNDNNKQGDEGVPDNGDPDSLRGDNMPKHWHWQANQPHLQRGGILGSIHEARQGLRTTPGTFLPALNSGSDDDDLFSSSSGNDDDELSVGVGSVGTSGSGKLWDMMESNRHIMESKESKRAKMKLRDKKLAEQKVVKRKMYVRRVAKAVVLGVALTTLTASGVYFVVEEDFVGVVPSAMGFFASLFGNGDDDVSNEEVENGAQGDLRDRKLPMMVPSAMGFFASLFGNGDDVSNEQVEKGAQGDLRDRNLPITGGVHQDMMTPASDLEGDQRGNMIQPVLTGDQGNQPNQQSDNGLSLQERSLRARNERIENNRRAREGRLVARQERIAQEVAYQANELRLWEKSV